jgi:hypothetical protein
VTRYIIVGESVRSPVLRRLGELLSNDQLGGQNVVLPVFSCKVDVKVFKIVELIIFV